jgi:hypothetical protein
MTASEPDRIRMHLAPSVFAKAQVKFDYCFNRSAKYSLTMHMVTYVKSMSALSLASRKARGLQ